MKYVMPMFVLIGPFVLAYAFNVVQYGFGAWPWPDGSDNMIFIPMAIWLFLGISTAVRGRKKW